MRILESLRDAPRRVVLLVVAVLVAAAALSVGSVFGGSTTTIVVELDQAKGVYVGDDVTILGVPVGEVTLVTPGPESVEVEIEVGSDTAIPADAKAVLVAPSLVSVRHIALTPVYDGGEALEDGDTIPVSRTAVPVEWDQIKEEIVRLTTALGPDGANADGALNDLLETSAENLTGNGADLNATISSLSEAMSTLSDSGGDIFGTVRNLQVFVTALEQSDAQVAEFNQRLAEVSGFLAEDSASLQAALTGLEQAFPVVQQFLVDHADDLTLTLDQLQAPAANLADNRQKLADLLHVAPSTLSNFYNIIDPDIPALTGAFAVPNLQTPAMFICSALYSLGGLPADCAAALEPVAQFLRLDNPPVGLSPLLRNGRENVNPVRPSDGNPNPVQPSTGGAPVADADLLGQIDGLLGSQR